MAFSDALDREAAWLSASGDGLPALLRVDGGPFQLVQARWPRVQATRKTALYVLRSPSNTARVQRFAAERSMATHRFLLRLFWPLANGQGSAEDEQLAFEQAIDLVLQRVEGVFGDHTHGGRFLSAAEPPEPITVTDYDPARDMKAGVFIAAVTYTADDPDFAN